MMIMASYPLVYVIPMKFKVNEAITMMTFFGTSVDANFISVSGGKTFYSSINSK